MVCCSGSGWVLLSWVLVPAAGASGQNACILTGDDCFEVLLIRSSLFLCLIFKSKGLQSLLLAQCVVSVYTEAPDFVYRWDLPASFRLGSSTCTNKQNLQRLYLVSYNAKASFISLNQVHIEKKPVF